MPIQLDGLKPLTFAEQLIIDYLKNGGMCIGDVYSMYVIMAQRKANTAKIN